MPRPHYPLSAVQGMVCLQDGTAGVGWSVVTPPLNWRRFPGVAVELHPNQKLPPQQSATGVASDSRKPSSPSGVDKPLVPRRCVVVYERRKVQRAIMLKRHIAFGGRKPTLRNYDVHYTNTSSAAPKALSTPPGAARFSTVGGDSIADCWGGSFCWGGSSTATPGKRRQFRAALQLPPQRRAVPS